jgi:hypothetical protein
MGAENEVGENFSYEKIYYLLEHFLLSPYKKEMKRSTRR